MKRIILTILSLFLFTTIAIMAQPKLSFDCGKRIDLGELSKGATTSTVVTLINSGNKTLEIDDIRYDKKYITLNFENMILEPGESRHIDISVNTGDLSGKILKSISFRTNGTKKVRPFFNIYFMVPEPLEIDHTPVILVGEADNPATGSFKMINNSKSDVQIKSVKTTDGLFVRNETPASLSSGTKFEFELLLLEQSATNQFITIETSHPDYPEIRIPVHARFKK